MDKRVEAAAQILFRNYESEHSAGHLSLEDDFAPEAREILDAADAADDCVRVPRELLEEMLSLVSEGRWVDTESNLRRLIDGN